MKWKRSDLSERFLFYLTRNYIAHGRNKLCNQRRLRKASKRTS